MCSSSFAEIIGSYFGMRSSHTAKRDFTFGSVLKSLTHEFTLGLSKFGKSHPLVDVGHVRALFDELDARLGAIAAVFATSVLFALMHVPLYGWHVVPLDLGVGLWLAGLRLATGGIAAPAMAHTIADLATWWL